MPLGATLFASNRTASAFSKYPSSPNALPFRKSALELSGFFAIAWVLVVRPGGLGACGGYLVSGVYSALPVFLFEMTRRHIGVDFLEHEIDLLDIQPHTARFGNIYPLRFSHLWHLQLGRRRRIVRKGHPFRAIRARF
jgi:hypothetical protein